LRGAPSSDASLLFGPGERQRLGESGDCEIGGGGSVDNGRDHPRRHEGERGEETDMPFDLALALRNLREVGAA
jgi:hypothetical protein